MVLNQAKNIMLGSTEVQKVYLGRSLIWERKKSYDPSKITLVRLDDDLQETSEIFEYDSFSDEIKTKLKDGSKYNAYIGEEAGIKTIPSFAFYDCSNLISVTIPSSVTTISDHAFALCYKLASITIPNSVTSIGNYAFQSCYRLTSVTIPSSVTSIGNYAFNSCSKLTTITVEKSADSISGAPWGAPNATVIWTG